MKRIDIQKENGHYNIDILDDNKYLAGTIIDLKRKQYYLILPDGYDKDSVNYLVENIINKIALKKYNFLKEERVGDIKSYSDELLVKILKELGLEETKEDFKIENLGILSINNKSSLTETKHI